MPQQLHTRPLTVALEQEPRIAQLFRSHDPVLERYFQHGTELGAALNSRLRSLGKNGAGVSPLLVDQYAPGGIATSDPELSRAILQGEGLVVIAEVRPNILLGSLADLYTLTTGAAIVRQLHRQTSRPVALVAWLRSSDFTPGLYTGVDAQGHLVSGSALGPPKKSVTLGFRGQPYADDLTELWGKCFRDAWHTLPYNAPEGQEQLRTGFACLLVQLFREVGIVVIDEESPGVCRQVAPFFHHSLSRSSALNRAMRAKALLMRREGHHVELPPVHTSNVRYTTGHPGAIPFQVELRDGRALGFSEEGRPAFSYSLQTFLRILKQAPERFLPDRALRPLLQAWSLPVVARVVSPDDLAAQAMAEEAYELLGLGTPVTQLAGRQLLVPTKTQSIMSKYQLSLADVWDHLNDRRDRVVARTDRLNLAVREHHLKAQLESAVREAAAGLDALTPELTQEARTLAAELQSMAERFFSDARETHRLENTQVYRDFRTLKSWLHPDERPQWTQFSPLPFLARQGLQLVDSLSSLAPDPLPQVAMLREVEPTV